MSVDATLQNHHIWRRPPCELVKSWVLRPDCTSLCWSHCATATAQKPVKSSRQNTQEVTSRFTLDLKWRRAYMIFTEESLQSEWTVVLPHIVFSFNLVLEVAKCSQVPSLSLCWLKHSEGLNRKTIRRARAGDMYSNHSLNVDPTCWFSPRAVVCKWVTSRQYWET